MKGGAYASAYAVVVEASDSGRVHGRESVLFAQDLQLGTQELDGRRCLAGDALREQN